MGNGLFWEIRIGFEFRLKLGGRADWLRGLGLVLLQSFPGNCLLCACLAEPISKNRGSLIVTHGLWSESFIEEIGVRGRIGFGREQSQCPPLGGLLG